MSWAVFEWARNPYVLLMVIYVFAPYLTNVVLGGGARGQTIFSSWQTLSGAIVALTSPFLGAAADRMGHRKPLLALTVAVMAPAVFFQYWALPHQAALPLWAIQAIAITAGVSYSWTEVLHNSMLTLAAKPNQVSQVSGLGLALGNAGGLLVLIFVLFAFALPGRIPIPGLPDHPLFGLNPAAFEPQRIVAPIVAVWLVVFAVPLFLFTPDRNPSGESLIKAIYHGVGNVARTILKLFREFRNVGLYLIARMIYVDGTTGVIVFGGIYASLALHWGFLEMLAFGVILSIFAVAGGFVSAWLDDWLGAKRAVLIEVIVTLLCLLIEVSITPTSMFFVIAADPSQHVWAGPIFRTAPEVLYLASSIVIAISITATYASSRALMAHLSPPGMEGELFGLYALSGSASAWLAPLMVTVFTAVYQSPRAGFGAIGLLLIVGFLLLVFVKPPPRPV
ncbi:MAG: MFS transporter [Proteobacteria bacterium]|nr:MFS transporter [Pseudomonadota bacterium]